MNSVEVRPEMTIVWPMGDYLGKRICIDLDGVVCEYDFPKIVKDFFGVDLSAQAIFAYDLPDVLGVSQVEINAMFEKQVYGKPHFIDGSLDILREWKAKGHRLYIYSNRVKHMGNTGLASWMVEHRIPFDKITDGTETYDIHIDDSPGKLMGTNSKLKLLYMQPWNRRCLNITGKLTRVKDWQEAKSYVHTLLAD